jgi:AcrR family transcriptional regulator
MTRPSRAPRRLVKDARREQLVACAMPVLAEQGLADFSLKDVVEPADVTRNLVYHYFPRGRADIVLAVVKQAEHELTNAWVTDPHLPLAERVAANLAYLMPHALKPSDAWRIHRKARAVDDAEVSAIVDDYLDIAISSIALNHLGTSDPPPLVRTTLNAYLAFAETLADEARVTNAPTSAVAQILTDTLLAAVQASKTAAAQMSSAHAP